MHNHPGDGSLWLSLCFLLLQLIFLSQKDYLVHSLAIAYHAQCSITLGRDVMDISKVNFREIMNGVCHGIFCQLSEQKSFAEE